jgi:hypothetical protein
MVGWGNGAEWDKAVAFFAKGNKWSYKELAKCVDQNSKIKLGRTLRA